MVKEAFKYTIISLGKQCKPLSQKKMECKLTKKLL